MTIWDNIYFFEKNNQYKNFRLIHHQTKTIQNQNLKAVLK